MASADWYLDVVLSLGEEVLEFGNFEDATEGARSEDEVSVGLGRGRSWWENVRCGLSVGCGVWGVGYVYVGFERVEAAGF